MLWQESRATIMSIFRVPLNLVVVLMMGHIGVLPTRVVCHPGFALLPSACS